MACTDARGRSCTDARGRSRSLSVAKVRLAKELRANMTIDNVPLSDEMRLKKQQRVAELEEILKLPVKERVSRGLAEG